MRKKSWQLGSILCIGLLTMLITGLHGENATLWEMLKYARREYLICAGLSFLAYFLMEALAFRKMLKHFGYNIGLGRCYGYALTDFFASSLSPGGSAGQPAQFMAMKNDGIAAQDVTVSLFAFNGVYHVMMLILAGIMLALGFTQRVAELPGMKVLIIYGALMQVYLVVLFSFLIFSEKTLGKVLMKLDGFLRKFSFFQKRLKDHTLENYFEKHQETACLLRRNPKIFFMLAWHLLGLFLFYYAIPYFVYRALGFDRLSLGELWAIQSVTVLAMESIPLPGGIGVSEISYAAVYNAVAPGAGFAMMVLSRGLSFYMGLILGGLYTTLKKPMRKEKLANVKEKLKVNKKYYQEYY